MKKRFLVVYWVLFCPVPCFGNTVNPHKNNTCVLCHSSPNFKTPQLCSSCHKCSNSKNRLRCLDCHEHHKTVEIIMLLKRKMVFTKIDETYENIHFPKNNCSICHGSEPQTRLNIKFSKNINSICLDCHAYRNCQHPVSITIPGYMRNPDGLLLDNEKKIICVTCHRQDCRGGGAISVIGYSRKNGIENNELCYRCHKHMRYNPHFSVTNKKNCQTCHTLKSQKGEINYTLFLNARLLCLLCHPERSHPGQSEHNNVFPFKENEMIQVDAFGRMTCLTCHTMHTEFCFSQEAKPSCVNCHERYF